METAEEVGEKLRDSGATLSTAESATGGLVSSEVVGVPGASDYFETGVVTYSYASKLRLGVSRESLDSEGAVSAEVAREMAASVRDSTASTWGVSTTGVAGPSGGTDEKPVGTVFVGVAYAGDWGTGESYAKAVRREYDAEGRNSLRRSMAEGALEVLLGEL